MIKFDNIVNKRESRRYYLNNSKAYSKAEIALIKNFEKELKKTFIQGFKSTRAFIKSNKDLLEKLDFSVKDEEKNISGMELRVNSFNFAVANCLESSISVDDYLGRYSDENLLVFLHTNTYFCPKCRQLKSLTDVVGNLSCCDIESVCINESTFSNDSIIFKKLEQMDKLKENSDVPMTIINASRYKDFENIYIVDSRKNIKFIKNGFDLTVNNQIIGNFSHITLRSNEVFAIVNNRIKKLTWFIEMDYNLFDEETILTLNDKATKRYRKDVEVLNLESKDIKIPKDKINILSQKFIGRPAIEKYISNLSGNEFLEYLNLAENLNNYQLNSVAMGYSMDNDTSCKFVEEVSKGTIICNNSEEMENENNRLADSIIQFYYAWKLEDLFETLKSQSMKHRYQPNILGGQRYMYSIVKYPFLVNCSKYYSKDVVMYNNKEDEIIKFMSNKLTQKEFDEIFKLASLRGGFIGAKVVVDKNEMYSKQGNIEYISIFSYNTAKTYILKYGYEAYTTLCEEVVSNAVPKEGKQLTEAQANFREMIKKISHDVAQLKMFKEVVFPVSYYLDDIFINQDILDNLQKYLKVLYLEEKTVLFLRDFLRLRKEAEDEFVELRGRKENVKRLVLEHDYYLQMTRISKKNMAGIFKDRYEKFKPFRIKANEESFVVEAPREMSDIIKEGVELSHCVDSYGQVLENGQEMVLFVRKKRGEPLYTVSLDINGNVCQSSGYAHSIVPGDVLANLQREFAKDEAKMSSLNHFYNV